jgi:hypothetical protein
MLGNGSASHSMLGRMPVQPRKTFAPSFVLTIVGTVAVAHAQPDPGNPADRPISKNPPAPKTPTKIPPKKVPPKKDPPKAPTTDRHFHYMQGQDKKCVAHDNDACSMPNRKPNDPIPPCNPPPPQPVACPENLTLPVKVEQKAGSLDCFVDWGPLNCPKNAKCNPPAPRKVACPGA